MNAAPSASANAAWRPARAHARQRHREAERDDQHEVEPVRRRAQRDPRRRSRSRWPGSRRPASRSRWRSAWTSCSDGADGPTTTILLWKNPRAPCRGSGENDTDGYVPAGPGSRSTRDRRKSLRGSRCPLATSAVTTANVLRCPSVVEAADDPAGVDREQPHRPVGVRLLQQQTALRGAQKAHMAPRIGLGEREHRQPV